MPEDSLYSFPAPPSPDLSEWPGNPMGVSNTITRTKSRTAVHNKIVDATPGLFEKLLRSAEDHLDRARGREAIFEDDVVIHGIGVRATTNSAHLHDFWIENWYGLSEWQKATGHAPPAKPQVTVYALQGVTNEKEAAYYSHTRHTIIFFNTSYYGQLKSWVLGAVGRILAAEYGIHSIHGACVQKDNKGVLYIAPTGTGKSTSSYGLMSYPSTRFHSDDWVYVRYAYATRDNRRVHVMAGEDSDGSRARGYEVYRWLESHRDDGRACLEALTLDNRPLALNVRDLDFGRPLEAYAYTSEKVFYLRTNLVENFPLSACEILTSKEENVPDVGERFLATHEATLRSLIGEMRDVRHGQLCCALRGKTDAELARICGRLIAFDNARSMLDISKVLPAERVYTNPLEPVKLVAVMLLKRNADDPAVLVALPLEAFIERLLIGETPEKKCETAYNAYRAVDDKEERAFIATLEREATAPGRLYPLFAGAAEVPQSLREEFELFRMMNQAAHCYDLNTTLQRDPTVRSKREAVGRTLDIIARTLADEPRDVHLSLDNYREYIRGV